MNDVKPGMAVWVNFGDTPTECHVVRRNSQEVWLWDIQECANGPNDDFGSSSTTIDEREMFPTFLEAQTTVVLDLERSLRNTKKEQVRLKKAFKRALSNLFKDDDKGVYVCPGCDRGVTPFSPIHGKGNSCPGCHTNLDDIKLEYSRWWYYLLESEKRAEAEGDGK